MGNEHDLGTAVGQVDNPPREIEHRYRFPGVADVEALASGDLGPGKACLDRITEVVDVAERTDLLAVSRHFDRQLVQRAINERTDGAFTDLAGTVDVKRSNPADGEPMLPVVRVS